MQFLFLLLIIGLMHAARSFAPTPNAAYGAAGTTMAAGFLLIAALLAGNLFKACGLPRLTGYLALGIVAGPHLLELVSERMLVQLRIFNGVAISLIALTAGAEMDFRAMRPLLRGIASISVIAVVGTIGLLTTVVYFMRDMLPFAQSLDTPAWLAMSAVLGVTLSAQSPAVVVALRKEMEADGPMTRTVLGVVIVSDLVVILLFALASAIAKPMLATGAAVNTPQHSIAWEILGSIAAGLFIGALIAAFLRSFRSGGALFIIATGFLVAEVGQRIQLDPLLIALAAGILIRNFTQFGDLLHEQIEASSLPVYVSFFAVAGATIHIDALAHIGLPAALLVLSRATGFLTGNRIATRVAQSPDVVRRFAGFGLLPQAGLAIALALLFTRSFPELGESASALIFGVVAINEMLAPVAYRWALIRSGEAGRRTNPSEARP